MYEFGIEDYQSLSEFPGEKKSFGSKPLIIFLGSQWEFDTSYQRIQNLFLDLFRGYKADSINIQGVDHVMSVTAHEQRIYIRTYYIKYQRSNDTVSSS
jgi:ribosome production factor 2